MNEQHPASANAIHWTRIRNTDGTRRRGYTWNPVAGCLHGCGWQMPDGNLAICYAKPIAERFSKAYPEGFEHHYWRPHLLPEPSRLKEPAGIFVCSMGDLFGHWVEAWQIEKVLQVIRDCPQHVFQLLTKNPRRTLDFDMPDNVWLGASSPPDIFKGNPLSRRQQETMLRVTLRSLRDANAATKFMSFEPLSWDVSTIVTDYPGVLDWAIIGAASDGHKKVAPPLAAFRNLQSVLDRQSVATVYKGNMRALPLAAADWREDFPAFAFKSSICRLRH